MRRALGGGVLPWNLAGLLALIALASAGGLVLAVSTAESSGEPGPF